MAKYTEFKVGQRCETRTGADEYTTYIVVAKNENRKTITVVEEFDTEEITVPYKRMIDRNGNRFEWAKPEGYNIYSF